MCMGINCATRRSFRRKIDVYKRQLNGLHIATERDGDTLTCVVPPYRQDIEREADLAEEVLLSLIHI